MWPTTLGLRPQNENPHLEEFSEAKKTIVYTTSSTERDRGTVWRHGMAIDSTYLYMVHHSHVIYNSYAL